MRWRPSPVTAVMVSIALGLVGNLATNTVQVTTGWWPWVVWAAAALLVGIAIVIEVARGRADSAGPLLRGGLGSVADDLADVVREQQQEKVRHAPNDSYLLLEKILIACGVRQKDPLTARQHARKHTYASKSAPAEKTEQTLQLETAQRNGLVPLPGLKEGERDLSDPERNLNLSSHRRRPIRRLLRSMLAAMRLVFALLWRSRKGNASERQREVMLKQVRLRMKERIRDAEANHYLTPRFVLLEDQPHKGRRNRSSRRSAPVPIPVSDDSIWSLFNQAGEELVLVGKPGMGKTTQLAKLVHELAVEALDDLERRGAASTRPIPMLVSLSTYRGQELKDWLVAEINRDYEVPQSLVRAWIAQDFILPLFDGLDQAPPAFRDECAGELRRFRESCVGIVVGCREDELALARTIRAARYVRLDCPTRSDVQEFLLTNIDALADVHAALEEDISLWPLLQSPLMLNVIHGAYHGRKAEALRLPGRSNKERQDLIFDAYVRRMLLDERPLHRDDTPQQTLTWLTWLARTLTARGEDILHLDRLDLTWIPPQQQILPRVISGHLAPILGGLLTFGWLALAEAYSIIHTSLKDTALVIGSLLLVTTGQYITAEKIDQQSPSTIGPTAKTIANLPLIVTASFVMMVAKVDYFAPGVLLAGLAWMWVQLTAMEGTFRPVLTPVEQIRWTWRPKEYLIHSGRKHIFIRCAVAVMLGAMLVFLVSYAVHLFYPHPPWIASAAAVLLLEIYALGNNFEPSLQDDRPEPNEGIRRSVRFGLIHGLVSSLVVMVSLITLVSLAVPHANMRNAWLVAGFLATLYGLVRALRYGGLAVAQHWSIRFLLIRLGSTPRRYQQFLRDAQQRILLRRIGSGFVFHHQLLQEHLNTEADQLIARLKLDGSETVVACGR